MAPIGNRHYGQPFIKGVERRRRNQYNMPKRERFARAVTIEAVSAWADDERKFAALPPHLGPRHRSRLQNSPRVASQLLHRAESASVIHLLPREIEVHVRNAELDGWKAL